MKNIDKMNLTEEFKNRVDSIVEEDGYEYRIITSVTNRVFYGRHKKDNIIKYHLEHIECDYLEDEGFETILANGYVKQGLVVGEFLFRRKQ